MKFARTAIVTIVAASTLTAVVGSTTASPVIAADGTLVITGVIDGPLTGGLPKAIEVYAQTDVADLSAFGLEAANNGAASANSPEFTFPTGAVSAGTYLYVASESPGFSSFFGFAPEYTNAVANINGDDAILLYEDGVAVDVFGVVGQDGTGQPWDHLDGWAKRKNANDTPTTTFDPNAWTFSGTNALDGETTNATAATPFPLGASTTAPVLVINEIDYDQIGTDAAEFVEIANVGDAAADLGTATLQFVNGNGGGAAVYDTITLSGSLDPGDYYVVCANAATVANCDLDDDPDTNFIQNGAPDAIALLVDGTTVDTVSYEGVVPGFTEGTIGAPADSNVVDGSISRCPDGSDTDRNDVDFVFTTSTPGAVNDCELDPGPSTLPIHEVQGSGASIAITDAVSVEGIVTSLYESDDVLEGFFVQEEDADADADPNTSEGIFVFCGSCATTPTTGDLVTVTGTPSEFFGMSQIGATGAGDVVVVSSGNTLPTPVDVDLPAPGSTEAEATFESVEGMLVRFPDTMYVSEYFQLARFGTVVLTVDARPYQFTHVNAPSVSGYAAFLDDLATRRIILDDDNDDQNDAISGPDADEPYPYPAPGLSATNTFRGGDSITDLTGVMHWSWSGSSGTDAWRIRPVAGEDYTFGSDNPRPTTAPDPGGDLRVASFNVLNYFATIDGTSSGSSGPCGPSGTLDCRGADSEAERGDQLDKIVAAMLEIDADVLGIVEVENDDDTALSQIVDALNVFAGVGTYDYVATGAIGTDAIKVGLVYQPGSVTPVGTHAILDASVDPTFLDDKNRPALIQTFEQASTGERFTVAVNHFKSKGSSCTDVSDPDALDGQANCNLTRTAAATALAGYLATDPTGSGDPDVLILGDLNAYASEDPIVALETAGYTDLLETFDGTDSYTFVFDGQLGYLDHALANASLLPFVTGAAPWHINADEVPLLDYNDGVADVGEASFERKSNALALYAPDAYRSSDHDPIVVGLTLTSAPTVQVVPADDQDDPTNTSPVTFTATFDQAVTGVDATDIAVGGSAGATTATVTPVDGTTYTIEITGMTGSGTVTVTVDADAATNDQGQSNAASGTATVVYDVTKPTLALPSPISVSTDPGKAGAIVTFVAGADDPAIPTEAAAGARLVEATSTVPAVCSPTSGSFFPIGDTTVTCTAEDAAGNVVAGSFVVTVVDDEDPVVVDVPDQTFQLPSGGSGPIDFTPPTATDNSGQTDVSCTPSPGSVFEVGTTTVTCTVSDASGNAIDVTFDVVVLAPTTVPTTTVPTTTVPATTVPATTVPSTVGPTLPATGSEPNEALRWALVLIAAGGLLLVGVRRRSIR